MEKKRSIERMMMEVADILETIRKNEDKTLNLTPKLIEAIKQLKTTADLLQQTNKKIFEDAQIDIEKLTIETLDSSAVTSKDKQLIKQSKQIQQDARKMRLEQEKKITLKNSEKDKQKEGNRQKKERKKLFKSIGGDKNWIPL